MTIAGLSFDFMLGNTVVPISSTRESATFAAVVPQDPFVRKALGLALDRPLTICLGLESEILAALKKYSRPENEGDIETEEASFDAFEMFGTDD